MTSKKFLGKVELLSLTPVIITREEGEVLLIKTEDFCQLTNPKPDRLTDLSFCDVFLPDRIRAYSFCDVPNPRPFIGEKSFCDIEDPRGIPKKSFCAINNPRGPQVVDFCSVPTVLSQALLRLYCFIEDPRSRLDTLPIPKYCDLENPSVDRRDEVSFCDIDNPRPRP